MSQGLPAPRLVCEPAPFYVSLVRDCDDPHDNFLRIRDKSLWWKREMKLQEQQQSSTKATK